MSAHLCVMFELGSQSENENTKWHQIEFELVYALSTFMFCFTKLNMKSSHKIRFLTTMQLILNYICFKSDYVNN